MFFRNFRVSCCTHLRKPSQATAGTACFRGA
jgi:hypothetical protein